MKDNLIQREDYAYFNAQLWMTPCHGLSMETLRRHHSRRANIEALTMEIEDYKGPTALLVDTAAYGSSRTSGTGAKPLGQCWTLLVGKVVRMMLKKAPAYLVAADGPVRAAMASVQGQAAK